MQKADEFDYDDEDDEDDEPLWWDVVEDRYGRPLTEAEWRLEIKASNEEELSEEDIQQELQTQKDWLVLKAEIAAKKAKWLAIEQKELEDADCKKRAAAELHELILCPPIGEETETESEKETEEIEAWMLSINDFIRTRLDLYSLMEFCSLHMKGIAKDRALKNTLKRHAENHSLRDTVYLWVDENIKPGMALDSAASEVAGKIVPLKWRTVRDHLTEWKKLRSASTP